MVLMMELFCFCNKCSALRFLLEGAAVAVAVTYYYSNTMQYPGLGFLLYAVQFTNTNLQLQDQVVTIITTSTYTTQTQSQTLTYKKLQM